MGTYDTLLLNYPVKCAHCGEKDLTSFLTKEFCYGGYHNWREGDSLFDGEYECYTAHQGCLLTYATAVIKDGRFVEIYDVRKEEWGVPSCGCPSDSGVVPVAQEDGSADFYCGKCGRLLGNSLKRIAVMNFFRPKEEVDALTKRICPNCGSDMFIRKRNPYGMRKAPTFYWRCIRCCQRYPSKSRIPSEGGKKK